MGDFSAGNKPFCIVFFPRYSKMTINRNLRVKKRCQTLMPKKHEIGDFTFTRPGNLLQFAIENGHR